MADSGSVRVLICPDKYAGTLSAGPVARALAQGWHDARPGDEVVIRPLSDGGPGFLDVLDGVLAGQRIEVPTVDPLGRPVTGRILAHGTTGYLESAQACGLHLLRPDERDPKITTSYGLGPLVATAVESGLRRVVVGLGGSATNDAGAGLLAALGAVPVDGAGLPLPYGGAALVDCARLAGVPHLRGVEVVAATDVDSPLLGPDGASAVYGPQKGATEHDVLMLEAALERFAEVLLRDLPSCPSGLAALPGAGAAGGLGAAVLALGGRCESGIGLVWRLAGLDEALREADLVVTGEGSFDRQSLRGKVVAGVAGAARERSVPCVVVAGQVTVDRADAAAVGVVESWSLVDHVGTLAEALARPEPALRDIGARLAGQWSR